MINSNRDLDLQSVKRIRMRQIDSAIRSLERLVLYEDKIGYDTTANQNIIDALRREYRSISGVDYGRR